MHEPKKSIFAKLSTTYNKTVTSIKVSQQWASEKVHKDDYKDTPDVLDKVESLQHTKDTFKQLVKLSKPIFDETDVSNRAEIFLEQEIRIARDMKAEYNRVRLVFQVKKQQWEAIQQGKQGVFVRISREDAMNEFDESRVAFENAKKELFDAVSFLESRREQVFTDSIHDICRFFSEFPAGWHGLQPRYPNSNISVGESDSKLFGCTLEQALEGDEGEAIPSIIPILIKAVRDNGGMTQQGIFRVSAPDTELAMLRKQFSSGNFEVNTNNPNLPACLLKDWLRKLDGGLIPISLYDDALEIGRKQGDILRQLVAIFWMKLPNLNQRVLKILIELILEVAANETVNSMNLNNLSIVFAPGILHPPDNLDPNQQLTNTAYEVSFVKNMIICAPFRMQKRCSLKGNSNQPMPPSIPKGNSNQPMPPSIPKGNSNQPMPPSIPKGNSNQPMPPSIPKGNSNQPMHPFIPRVNSNQPMPPSIPRVNSNQPSHSIHSRSASNVKPTSELKRPPTHVASKSLSGPPPVPVRRTASSEISKSPRPPSKTRLKSPHPPIIPASRSEPVKIRPAPPPAMIPAPWQFFQTEDGEAYFFNPLTNEKRLERP